MSKKQDRLRPLPKRMARRKITFEDTSDEEVVLRGQLGIGNRELMRVTGLTNCQVTYRLSLAKKELGLEQGFRVTWRNGNHPLLERMLRDYGRVMRAQIERDLVPRLVHPTPKTIRVPSV